MIHVLNKYNPPLSKIIRSEILKQFTREMLAENLIMEGNLSYDDMITTFKASFEFQKTQNELAKNCSIFIKILKGLGGPLIQAADDINKEWTQILTI